MILCLFFLKLLELFYIKVVTGATKSADVSRVVSNEMHANPSVTKCPLAFWSNFKVACVEEDRQ